MSYLQKSGLLDRLAADGYQYHLSAANDELEKVELEGWPHVLIEQTDGSKARLKIRDHPIIGGYLVSKKLNSRSMESKGWKPPGSQT